MNAITHFFWNYINVGKERFYVEDPRVPFVNGFTLILLLILIPFGMQRIITGDVFPGYVNLFVSALLIGNVVYLRFKKHANISGLVLSLITIVLAVYVFYEGATGGDTGILWIFPIPTLIFFLSGKRAALLWSSFFGALLVLMGLLSYWGHIDLPYTMSQLLLALFPFSAIIGGLYMYAKFTEWNAQELEERTKSLRLGFELEKESIKKHSRDLEESLKSKIDTFFTVSNQLMIVVDVKTMKFLEVNPAVIKIFGYQKELLSNTAFIDLVHPEDKEKTIQVARDLASGLPMKPNFINRWRTENGTYVYLMWNAVHRDGAYYATAQPVDDLVAAQHKTEEKMKEIEELNKLMVGREIRMAELKEEISALKQRLGEK